MLVRERKKSLERIRVFNGGKKPRRLRAIAVLLLGVFFGMLLWMTSARTARRVLSRIHGGLDISSNEPELLNARVLGLNNFPTADSGKKWERPQLLPENMERLLTYRMRPTRMANQSISRLIDQVIPGKSRILGTEEELDAAKKIAKGLKIWVSPIDRYALNCLTVGTECDKNLGCWDKRLSLFLREVFSDVHPMEADFIFIPYFQYCYFYSSG
uniref:Uncharacterized protein n=2 Tax=Rhodosorus marinus TaxID=101924 RepID=A0A7S3EE54_9RHOD|mmetsp:Transcript_28885/g.112515  ORF Transcript_28885/g.112515 Transcript_28885/m.112515 type:complete len:214 (+) Transcript_28885:381-1022(+)